MSAIPTPTATKTAWLPTALIAVLVALAVSPIAAHADVLIRQDLPALHQRADKTVHARVVSVQSAWNVDRSFIFTTVTLDVLKHYKGAGPSRLEVRVPGGKVASYRIWAASMPEFHAGEEVLVFLTRWPDGALKVAGYAQGLSRITPSPQGALLHGGTLDKRLLADVEREMSLGGPGRP